MIEISDNSVQQIVNAVNGINDCLQTALPLATAGLPAELATDFHDFYVKLAAYQQQLRRGMRGIAEVAEQIARALEESQLRVARGIQGGGAAPLLLRAQQSSQRSSTLVLGLREE